MKSKVHLLYAGIIPLCQLPIMGLGLPMQGCNLTPVEEFPNSVAPSDLSLCNPSP